MPASSRRRTIARWATSWQRMRMRAAAAIAQAEDGSTQQHAAQLTACSNNHQPSVHHRATPQAGKQQNKQRASWWVRAISRSLESTALSAICRRQHEASKQHRTAIRRQRMQAVVPGRQHGRHDAELVTNAAFPTSSHKHHKKQRNSIQSARTRQTRMPTCLTSPRQ